MQGEPIEILGMRLWDGREVPFGPLVIGVEPLHDGLVLFSPGTDVHQTILLQHERFTVHTTVGGNRTDPRDTWLAADVAWASARLGDPSILMAMQQRLLGACIRLEEPVAAEHLSIDVLMPLPLDTPPLPSGGVLDLTRFMPLSPEIAWHTTAGLAWLACGLRGILGVVFSVATEEEPAVLFLSHRRMLLVMQRLAAELVGPTGHWRQPLSIASLAVVASTGVVARASHCR